MLIVTGPTASGKTDFSYALAQHMPAEIINADMGQFYTPLTVGTAKPDWQQGPVPAHLFDILDDPCDITVVKYCKMVLDEVNEITARNKIPILVGGSLFYIKSLFFPPKKIDSKQNKAQKFIKQIDTLDYDNMSKQELWNFLFTIDPERAHALHPNDTYRVKRALDIWKKTGEKPSSFLPEYSPAFNSIFVALMPSKNTLDSRIKLRTIEMINNEGWIEEAMTLIDTDWEPFLEAKGLIGYREIFSWIKLGKKEDERAQLIKIIQQETVQYAKRQMTFLRGLIQLFEKQKKVSSCNNVIQVTKNNIQALSYVISECHKIREKNE